MQAALALSMAEDAHTERAARSSGASPSRDAEPQTPGERIAGAASHKPAAAEAGPASAPAKRQARAKAVVVLDSDDEAPGVAEGASDPPAQGAQGAGPSGGGHGPAAGEQPKKKRRKGARAGLELTDDELGAVFAELAGGKVTIGRAEFEGVVTRLDLDVSGDMVDAAFELLRDSGHAGACDRVDGRQFVSFLRHVAHVAGL